MQKEIFIDTETTGFNPIKNGIIEIGGIIRYGKVYEEFNFNCCIFAEDEITASALEVNGYTEKDIITFPDPLDTYNSFIKLLDKHIDKYNSSDKAYFIGFGAEHDSKFIRAWFDKVTSKPFFGSYFWNPPIDVLTLAAQYVKNKQDRTKLTNFKLKSVSDYFEIKLEANEKLHSALTDAKLTMKIYDIVTK